MARRGRRAGGPELRPQDGRDPELHADAFDAKVQANLDDGSYIDPSSGTVTLAAFAEEWRRGRTHDVVTAGNVERRLRLHVYADPATPGVTPTGAPAIGHRQLRSWRSGRA